MVASELKSRVLPLPLQYTNHQVKFLLRQPRTPILRISPLPAPLPHLGFSYPQTGRLTKGASPEMRGPSSVTLSIRNSSQRISRLKRQHLMDCKTLAKCKSSLLEITSIKPTATHVPVTHCPRRGQLKGTRCLSVLQAGVDFILRESLFNCFV